MAFWMERVLSFLVSYGLSVSGVVVDNKAALPMSLVELANEKLQPGVIHRSEGNQRHYMSPVDFEYYRFSLSKGSLELDDLFLYDYISQALDLTDPQIVLQVRLGGPEILSSSGNVGPCVDGKSDTKCHLDQGQNIVLKLAPGRPITAYGFTVANLSGTVAPPVDFSMAGSADGSHWKNLSVKRSVEMPKGDALMVGPYVLLDPTNEVKMPSVAPDSWATESHPAKVSEGDMIPTMPPMHLPFSPVPPVTAAPPPAMAPEAEGATAAAQKVSEAVRKASEQSQLPLPEELASAAAAGAAAMDRPSGQLTPEAIVEVAKGAGLGAPMLQHVMTSLMAVDCKHYGAIMAMWNSASLAKDNGMDIAAKVKDVVMASADAGFAVEQQAEAGAAAAAAGLAHLTTEGPRSVIGEVIMVAGSLGLELDMLTKMAAVLETQSSQEQAALLMLLEAAMQTTTPAFTEPNLHNATAAAKMVGEQVAKALRYLKVDPQKKAQVISAAAAAAQWADEHTTTTTTFDGVKLVVEAAQDAGIKDILKLKKVQDEARVMTPEQQKAAARSLEAAGSTIKNSNVTTTTRSPQTAQETVEKVSEVVKAAAASGMTEDQQAQVAATAVVAASPAMEDAVTGSTVQEPGLTKLVEAAKDLGLSTDQQDALLSSVNGDADAVDAIRRTMAAAGIAAS